LTAVFNFFEVKLLQKKPAAVGKKFWLTKVNSPRPAAGQARKNTEKIL